MNINPVARHLTRVPNCAELELSSLSSDSKRFVGGLHSSTGQCLHSVGVLLSLVSVKSCGPVSMLPYGAGLYVDEVHAAAIND